MAIPVFAGEKEDLEKRWVELNALKVGAEKQFVDVSIEMRQVAARYQAVLVAEKAAEDAKKKDEKKGAKK